MHNNKNNNDKLWMQLINCECKYIEDITRWREDMNFIFEWQKNIVFATRK